MYLPAIAGILPLIFMTERQITPSTGIPPRQLEGHITLDEILFQLGFGVTRKTKKYFSDKLREKAKMNGLILEDGTTRFTSSNPTTYSLRQRYSPFVPLTEVESIKDQIFSYIEEHPEALWTTAEIPQVLLK